MSLPEQLAEAIAAWAAGPVFGVPGSGSSLELIDALEHHGVPFHTTVSEGAAALMAGTVGRLTGRAGVCVTIKGPGLANAVPGLAACHFEALPVVAIAEAYAPDSPHSVAHKRLDHAALSAAVAKGNRYASESGPSFAELAGWAEAEVPGPVVLNLAAAPVPGQEPPPTVPAPAGGPPLSLVARARRPVVIAGTLAGRRGCGDKLSRLRIPVFTTAAAKGVVDETLPHAAGVYTGVGGRLAPETALLADADLVVGLGLVPNEVLRAVPFACPSVAILGVADPVAIDGFGYDAVCGHAHEAALFAALLEKEWGLEQLAERREVLWRHMNGGRFGPVAVFAALEHRFHGACRVVLDTGNFCTLGEHAMRCRRWDLALSSGQGRYMGTAIPMAVAAALHDRSVPTVAVVGDGGIGPSIAELGLAVRERLPLLVVLMSDGGFGSIRARAIRDGLTQKPLVFGNLPWAAVMEGFGLSARRATDADGVADVLEAFDPAEGPAFVEAEFDADAYQAMVEGIR